MSGGKERDSSVSNTDIQEKATGRPRYFLTAASLNKCGGVQQPQDHLVQHAILELPVANDLKVEKFTNFGFSGIYVSIQFPFELSFDPNGSFSDIVHIFLFLIRKHF